MADIFEIDLKETRGRKIVCPVCQKHFLPARMGTISCMSNHEFTLSVRPVGIVRIDNVGMQERLDLMAASSAAVDMVMDSMNAVDRMIMERNPGTGIITP